MAGGALHSKNFHASRKVSETKYASGAGASAYDQTELASPVAMARIRSWSDNMFPMQKIAKEALESSDDGIYGGEIVDVGWEAVDSSREEYIQDSFYFDKVISTLALQGELPPSYCLHWQDHIHDVGTPANDNLRYEAYGVFVKKLALKIPKITGKKDGYPYWVVDEGCYSIKYDDGIDSADLPDSLTKVPWLAIGANPVAVKSTYTVGGVDVGSIEAELAITLAYTEDKENGDDGNKYPYFLNFDEIVFIMTFRTYTQYKAFVVNVLKGVSSESRYTVKITSGLAACYPQITNMMVSEGDLNRIPEPGMAKYTMTLVNSEDSILSKESS